MKTRQRLVRQCPTAGVLLLLVLVVSAVWIARRHPTTARSEAVGPGVLSRGVGMGRVPRVEIVWRAAGATSGGEITNLSAQTLRGIRILRAGATGREEEGEPAGFPGALLQEDGLGPDERVSFELPMPVRELPSGVRLLDAAGHEIHYRERIEGVPGPARPGGPG